MCVCVCVEREREKERKKERDESHAAALSSTWEISEKEDPVLSSSALALASTYRARSK